MILTSLGQSNVGLFQSGEVVSVVDGCRGRYMAAALDRLGQCQGNMGFVPMSMLIDLVMLYNEFTVYEPLFKKRMKYLT